MIVHILSLNDDDDDAKALPTGVLKDDAMKKGGWGGQNVSKSDGVILVCSLTQITILQWIKTISNSNISRSNSGPGQRLSVDTMAMYLTCNIYICM